jgi:hypothetical protein
MAATAALRCTPVLVRAAVRTGSNRGAPTVRGRSHGQLRRTART